jgi:hypothetical protein
MPRNRFVPALNRYADHHEWRSGSTCTMSSFPISCISLSNRSESFEVQDAPDKGITPAVGQAEPVRYIFASASSQQKLRELRWRPALTFR